MNIFEEVNKELDKLLEGDVVSFTDLKKAKEADKAIEGASDEVVHITLEGINTQNYSIDGTAILESSVLYDFKYLQTIFYALDHLQEGEAIPFKYKAGMIVEKDGEKERFVHEGYITIGQGSEQANILNELEPYMTKLTGKTTVFDGDIVPSESDIQKKIIELQKLVRNGQETKAKGNLAPAKDYSNGGTKKGVDVEVGDILVQTFLYGSTQHYFYKVIDKTASSVKLAKLKKSTDLKNDDDGRVVPTEIVEPCKEVDGRSFRIFKPKGGGEDIICKLEGKALYYWDGKPKHETYMD